MGERVPCQTIARSRSPRFFKRYTEGAADTMILDKQALEAFREALESHHRSLERLESALIELEETLTGREDRQERPQAKRQGGGARRGLDLLSITEVSQELGMSKSWVYGRIRSGEIPSIKLGHNTKVRREDLEGYLAGQGVHPITYTPQH